MFLLASTTPPPRSHLAHSPQYDHLIPPPLPAAAPERHLDEPHCFLSTS